MKSSRTETELFSNHTIDRTSVFVEMYHRYAAEIFAFCAMGLRTDNVQQTEQVVQQVFIRAHRYIHKFQPTPQRSFKLYLLELAEQVLEYYTQQAVPSMFMSPLPKVIPMAEWESIRQFNAIEQRCCVLRYGLKLEVFEIATVMQRDVDTIQHTLQRCSQQLNEQALRQLYSQWHHGVSITFKHPAKLLKQIQAERPLQLAFARQQWWRRWLVPVGVIVGVLCISLSAGWLWLNVSLSDFYVPIDTVDATNSSTEPAIVETPFTTVNTATGQLPMVQYNLHSLAQPNGTLYGTKYIHQNDNPNTITETELHPSITINLPATAVDFIPQAYIYTTPEALTEVQLELLALRYFSSIPLNQFTYVNGTYYVAESETIFRPLFIAFNGDGSVEFQMRQAAICTLPKLTTKLTDVEANDQAFNFVAGHHLVEVSADQVQMVRVSEDNRTLTKNTFCKDGDAALVQDREIVVFPPHTTLHFTSGANDLLPLRLPGIDVQLHGDTVTNMRMDKLSILQEYVTKSDTVPLIALDDALTTVKQFYYPATDKQPEYQRFVRSFIEWKYSHADSRLKTVDIDSVKLEYVFDDLNRTVEPYYVFSGTGVDSTGKHQDDVRLYVVASVKNIELRSPYRE